MRLLKNTSLYVAFGTEEGAELLFPEALHSVVIYTLFLLESKNAALIGYKKAPHFRWSLSVLKMKGQLNTVAFSFKKQKWQFNN